MAGGQFWTPILPYLGVNVARRITSSPRSRAARHVVRCEEYTPPHRSSALRHHLALRRRRRAGSTPCRRCPAIPCPHPPARDSPRLDRRPLTKPLGGDHRLHNTADGGTGVAVEREPGLGAIIDNGTCEQMAVGQDQTGRPRLPTQPLGKANFTEPDRSWSKDLTAAQTLDIQDQRNS